MPGTASDGAAMLDVETWRDELFANHGYRIIVPGVKLESVPLYVFAEFMRDGTWVDIATEKGAYERVKIVEIKVRADLDKVAIYQEWLVDDKLLTRKLELDCESIWRAKKSTKSLFDIAAPPMASVPAATSYPGIVDPRPGGVDEVFRSILWTLHHKIDSAYGMDAIAPLMVSRALHGGVREPLSLITLRRVGILLQYGMTIDTGLEAAKRFGYRSAQPYDSARQLLDRASASTPHTQTAEARGLHIKCVATARHVKKRLGFEPCKPGLSRSFPALYDLLASAWT